MGIINVLEAVKKSKAKISYASAVYVESSHVLLQSK